MADGMDRRGGGGRTIVIILVVVAVLAVLAYALGLFNVDASGELEAPNVDVAVEGGEVPDVQVETADIDVGTQTETVKLPDVDVSTTEEEVKLPTIDVDPAGDDNSANK
jgi:flagellar basal body-associated protein FliL